MSAGLLPVLNANEAYRDTWRAPRTIILADFS